MPGHLTCRTAPVPAAGHVPLHKIPENMQKQLEWCNEVRLNGGPGL